MTTARYDTLESFRAGGAATLAPGPAALLVVEDHTEIASTLDHLAARGFRAIAAFVPSDIELPEHPAQPLRITVDTRRLDAMTEAVNATLSSVAPGTWLHACYNAEYLMFPFCETRSVGEMLAFHTEERRDAMLTFVVDLYARDLATHPGGVDRAAACLDRIGYYALARPDPDRHNHPHTRQLDFFGGLRWRFEEHVDVARRRIDRIGLFRAKPGLALRADGTFNDSEYNTYACQWHNNLTATICSFRAAKALCSNPLSRAEIASFLWQGSSPFDWSSRTLMDLGLMEPGQWF